MANVKISQLPSVTILSGTEEFPIVSSALVTSQVTSSVILNYINGNVTSVGTLTTLSATGNITGGNISATNHTGTNVSVTGAVTAASVVGTVYTNSIVNSGSNATGNIGSLSTYFNTVFATATKALYADLAECYLADAEYAPGTVVSFGGEQEITLAQQDHDTAVAGVVSTQPAYQMNSGLTGDHVVTVALIGRVPCQVQGPVRKGALMVSAGNGRARAETNPAPGAIIGKTVQSFDGDVGTIEIVVGRV